MEVSSPQTSSFEKNKKYSNYSKILFWISTGFSLIIGILTLFKIDCDLIKILFVLPIVLMFIFDYVSQNNLFEAEKIRRKGFIDNSFDKKLSDSNSKNYYDTDDVNHGFFKAFVNIFENSLFSSRISTKMRESFFNYMIIIVPIIFIAVVLFVKMNYSNFFMLIIQIFLSKHFALKLFVIKDFNTAIKNIYEEIINLFNLGLNEKNYQQYSVNMFKIILDYETTITFYKLNLDSKIYNEINESLTKEWNEMKVKYGIVQNDNK